MGYCRQGKSVSVGKTTGRMSGVETEPKQERRWQTVTLFDGPPVSTFLQTLQWVPCDGPYILTINMSLLVTVGGFVLAP